MPIKPIAVAGLVLALIAAGCSSSESTDGAETSTPKSTEAEVTAELDRLVGELRVSEGEEWGITVPGLAAAAITSDSQTDNTPAVVSGVADPPGDTPLEDPDRFHIGSATKSFTAALILQLDQEGKLSLGDPIGNWIDYPNGQNITVEMLLSHTSGVPNFTEDPNYNDDPGSTPDMLIAISERMDPVFAPGTSWSYSNTNFVMLGVIAEMVTGSTWQEEVESRFLLPLDLTDTYVWTGEPRPPTVDGSRLACGGAGEPDCDPPESGVALLPVSAGSDWTLAWAAGALVSTPTDLARWMRALVTGDVLDAEHRELLTTATPQSVEVLSTRPPSGSLRWTGYSLGLCRFEIDGEGVGWGHSGIINGFVSNTVQMTDSGHTVSLTSNYEYLDMRATLGDLVIGLAGVTSP